jgi:hypothetical protein
MENRQARDRMETRNQRRIREILGESEQVPDHSLRGHALRRARSEEAPRTLTAWEWEQWYAEHGVPERHHTGPSKNRAPPWWRRLLGGRR